MSSNPDIEKVLAASRGWRGLSLRVVLLAAIVLVVLATLTLASISVLRLMRNSAEREHQTTVEVLTQSLAGSTEAELADRAAAWVSTGTATWIATVGYGEGAVAWGAGDVREDVTLEIAREAGEANGLVSGLARASAGRVAIAAIPWRSPAAPTLDGELDPNGHLEPSPQTSEAGVGDVLVVAISMRGSDARLAGAQGLVLLYLVLVGLVVLLFGYVLVTRSVVRPVRKLVRAAQRVAEGDLETWVVAGGVGEVAELAGRFNVMIDAVRHEQQHAADSLEALEASNARLRVAQDELLRSERLATVGKLAAGVAHEIGNPLSSVLAYLDLLAEPDTTPEQREAFLTKANDATRRIHTIIRELLDYSRADRAEVGPCPVAAVVEQALSLVRPQPRFRDIELVVDLPEGLPPARADEQKLVQILVNLLLNAADALAGQGRVEVAAVASDVGVEVTVRDDGPGIPENILPRVFDPFFTTKDPGSGTGLGLAMCERLATQIGAALAVESSPQGTTFIVTLKRAERRGGAEGA